MAWEEDGLLHFPNDPINWRPKLIKRNEKLERTTANVISIIYFGLLFWILNTEDVKPFLFFASFLPPLVYFYRRFRKDFLTQGYLDGYAEGYGDAYEDSSYAHNKEMDK